MVIYLTAQSNTMVMTIIYIYKAISQILGNKCVLLITVGALSSCNDNNNKSVFEKTKPGKGEILEHREPAATKIFSPKKDKKISCTYYEKGFAIDLFNNTSKDSIIGGPDDSYEGYIKSRAWSNDGPYPPKYFDLQVTSNIPYDSLSIEMNISYRYNSAPLLKDNILIARKTYDKQNRFLIKDIGFEKMHDKYPDLKCITFLFHVSNDFGKCSFVKVFKLHEDE